ncbi:hypothetical protein DM01DRAFT_301898 [Hesseltinella vesiculosa]|uniref:Uncharacterized protein n=1 Tax=Hesseltinella vesiculosa TaxID=101127 RepID=A0A1X2GBY2_9FUNG|nr:hypothetical protein DM01DRAFT_301898 [Hesseltinella vesiculosa]
MALKDFLQRLHHPTAACLWPCASFVCNNVSLGWGQALARFFSATFFGRKSEVTKFNMHLKKGNGLLDAITLHSGLAGLGSCKVSS